VGSARSGRGRLVEIVGDAGLGKTRLLEAMRDAANVPRGMAAQRAPQTRDARANRVSEKRGLAPRGVADRVERRVHRQRLGIELDVQQRCASAF
jgi:ABC-type branched-subunit amino acid transport system ATPase component